MNAPTSPDAFRASRRPAGHPPVRNGRVGVLLVNLGTPEATDYWSMRRYLKEFLSDRRVDRDAAADLVADPQPRHPDQAAGPPRARTTPRSGTRERDEGPLKTITRGAGGKARPSADARAAGRARRGRLGDALRQAVDRRAPRRAAGKGLRPHSASCRSIRNIARRRPRRSATRRSTRCRRCAGSRPCASPRPITTIPSTSRRSRARHARRSPSSTSSRRSCSPRSTASRRTISTRAIPITAIAPRRRGCCAKRWACAASACA